MALPPKFLVLGGSGTGKTTATTTFLQTKWLTNIHILSTQPQTTRVWSSYSSDPRVHIHCLYPTNELDLLIKRVNLIKSLPYELLITKPDEDKRKYSLLPNFLEAVATIKSTPTTVVVVDMISDIFAAVRDTIAGKAFTESLPLFYACQRLALDVVSGVVSALETSHIVCLGHTEPVKNSVTQDTIEFVGDKRDNKIVSNFSDILYSYLEADKQNHVQWYWTNYNPSKCKVFRLGQLKAGTYSQDYPSIYNQFGINP